MEVQEARAEMDGLIAQEREGMGASWGCWLIDSSSSSSVLSVWLLLKLEGRRGTEGGRYLPRLKSTPTAI
jgi:hypothetical protein